MTPGLEAFLILRLSYLSACQANFLAFERVPTLTPDIEACAISTLSQSPMRGFLMQMDNHIGLIVHHENARADDLTGCISERRGRLRARRCYRGGSLRRGFKPGIARESHDKCGAFPFTIAFGAHFAAVQLDDVADDRQPDPE